MTVIHYTTTKYTKAQIRAFVQESYNPDKMANRVWIYKTGRITVSIRTPTGHRVRVHAGYVEDAIRDMDYYCYSTKGKMDKLKVNEASPYHCMHSCM